MVQLSCKFDESKWHPYWLIMLTTSSGINYVPNDHEAFDHMTWMQYNSRWCHVKFILQVWWIKWNPYWLIVLTSSYGTNYVLNEYEDFDQYG